MTESVYPIRQDLLDALKAVVETGFPRGLNQCYLSQDDIIEMEHTLLMTAETFWEKVHPGFRRD